MSHDSNRRRAVLLSVAIVGLIALAMATVAFAATPKSTSTSSGAPAKAGKQATRAITLFSPPSVVAGSSAFSLIMSLDSTHATVPTWTVSWSGPTGGAVFLAVEASGTASVTAFVPAPLVTTVGFTIITVGDGTDSWVSSSFSITAPGPVLTGIDPATGANNNTGLPFTLTGTNLSLATVPLVSLKGPGPTGETTITATSLTSPSNTTMTGTFNLASPIVAPAGLYDVVLTYAGTKTVKLTQKFTVTSGPPTITAISPTTTWVGSVKPQVLTVTGAGFVASTVTTATAGSQVKIGARLTTNTTFVSATQVTVPLLPGDIAVAGAVPITVVNPASAGGTSTAVNLAVATETSMPVSTIAGADAKWHNKPVVLTVTAADSESGVQSTQWGIGTVPPWTLLVGTPMTITVPALSDHSGDGVKIVSVQSTDWCNKVETSAATATVRIDTLGPKTTASVAAVVRKGAKVSFGYRANDRTAKCVITLKIKRSSSVVRTYALGGKSSNTSLRYNVKPNLAKGTYKYYVYATDQAGNKQSALGVKTFKVR